VDVFDRTGSNSWVSALLIVDFLPIILIGLLAAPLVDRFSRRRLLIASDLVRAAVFCVLPFAGSALAIVVLAGVQGIATGLFRPAVYAGMPNLVDDAQLPEATSLLQTVENLTWTVGPVVGGIVLAGAGPELAYWLNAATFMLSAVLLARIPAVRLQVWNVVMLGVGGINVAEVALAKVSLDAGDLGFGILVGAGGLGLTLGSFAAGQAVERLGIGRAYFAGIALMAAGYGLAALAPSILVAVPAVVAASVGNGAAVVCNALLVQRGAPDRLRGRAFTVIMSSNYALLGLGMVAAGPLTDAYGARVVWGAAAGVYLLGALLSVALAPRRREEPAVA
jgi:MFS family permease